MKENQGEALHIINSEGIAYHPQQVAVYHQAAGGFMHGFAVMRYKVGLPTLMICTALRVAMICQACGLDKKRTKQKLRSFLMVTKGLESLCVLPCHYAPCRAGACSRRKKRKSP